MNVKSIVITKYERFDLKLAKKLYSLSLPIFINPKQMAKTVKKVYGILYFGSVVMLQIIYDPRIKPTFEPAI
jgi:hypothetical protein